MSKFWKWLLNRLGLGWLVGTGEPPEAETSTDTSPPPEPAPQPDPVPVPRGRWLKWVPCGQNGWPTVESRDFDPTFNTDIRGDVQIIRKSGAAFVSSEAFFALQKDGSYILHANWHRPLAEIPYKPLVSAFGVRFQFSDRHNEESVLES